MRQLLFEPNKFSGFDRTEGGIRVNVGIRHLLQLNNGGYNKFPHRTVFQFI